MSCNGCHDVHCSCGIEPRSVAYGDGRIALIRYAAQGLLAACATVRDQEPGCEYWDALLDAEEALRAALEAKP